MVQNTFIKMFLTIIFTFSAGLKKIPDLNTCSTDGVREKKKNKIKEHLGNISEKLQKYSYSDFQQQLHNKTSSPINILTNPMFSTSSIL